MVATSILFKISRLPKIEKSLWIFDLGILKQNFAKLNMQRGFLPESDTRRILLHAKFGFLQNLALKMGD